MASDKVLEFTEDNWASEVANSDVPVVVDFWAPWCGPCRQLGPIIDRLADKYAGKVKVGKLNVDENGSVASKYAVMNIPRVLVFKGGETPTETIVGLNAETKYVDAIDRALAG